MAECFSGTDNCIAAVVETKEDVNHHHTSFPMEPNGPLSPSISGLSLNGSSLVPSVANATNTDESVPAPSVDEQQLQTIQRRRRRRRATVPGAASVVEVDPLLLERVMAASHLPNAYAFEIVKTVQRIVALQCTHVALQLPEGLVRYATAIADVLLALTASVSTATVATTRATDDSAAPTPVVHLLKHVSVLADVTYGACCVDDIGAAALQCQLLVHYGHSCLVPLQHTVIPVLYVFVEIQMDANHVGDCLLATIQDQNEEPQQQPLLLLTRDHEEALTATPDPATTMTATTTVEPLLRSAGLEKDLPDVTFGATRTDAESATFLKPTPASPNSPTSSLPNHPGNANHHHHQQQQQEPPLHVYLLGTVQFRHALTAVRDRLTSSSSGASMTVSIPQCHPLSPGEVLGCTSPILKDHLLSSSSNNDNTTDHRRRRAIVCFVADGRFHLESTMLSHASTIDAFYRYDPYTEVLSEEIYGAHI